MIRSWYQGIEIIGIIDAMSKKAADKLSVYKSADRADLAAKLELNGTLIIAVILIAIGITNILLDPFKLEQDLII